MAERRKIKKKKKKTVVSKKGPISFALTDLSYKLNAFGNADINRKVKNTTLAQHTGVMDIDVLA